MFKGEWILPIFQDYVPWLQSLQMSYNKKTLDPMTKNFEKLSKWEKSFDRIRWLSLWPRQYYVQSDCLLFFPVNNPYKKFDRRHEGNFLLEALIGRQRLHLCNSITWWSILLTKASTCKAYFLLEWRGRTFLTFVILTVKIHIKHEEMSLKYSVYP